MAATGDKRIARENIIQALRRELMGPSILDEAIDGYPTSRYIVGRLAPAREDESDMAGAIDQTENEGLGAGADDNEAGSSESQAAMILGFNPSSIGISFLVEASAPALELTLSWGDYKREKDAQDKTIWKRYPRRTIVTGLDVSKSGKLPRLTLTGINGGNDGVETNWP